MGRGGMAEVDEAGRSRPESGMLGRLHVGDPPECMLSGRPSGSTERNSGTRSAIVLVMEAVSSAV